jgi:hypothetical protein
MAREDTLSLVSSIDEFMELHDFMSDPDLDEALSIVVKLMANPEVPSVKAVPLIVRLQAIAAKLSIQAAIYTTIKKGPSGSPNMHKKNVYYSTAEALNKIVDALKYSARYNMV